MSSNDPTSSLDALVSLCKRRGFIFPSSEIYGGLNGFWDYGPMGVELRRRVLDSWWNRTVRRREHDAHELAHYAKYTTDVEYQIPIGRQELEGVANRGNYDLTQHMEASGKDQSYFDPTRQEKYVPSVIETSAGLDRTVLTVLSDAFAVERVGDQERTVLRFAPHIAPRQVAVFPLVKKLTEPTRRIADGLRGRFHTLYDVSGSIGKRYRREDEVGTPFCVTIDFQTLEDDTVTVRDRDSMEQERVGTARLAEYLAAKLSAC